MCWAGDGRASALHDSDNRHSRRSDGGGAGVHLVGSVERAGVGSTGGARRNAVTGGRARARRPRPTVASPGRRDVTVALSQWPGHLALVVGNGGSPPSRDRRRRRKG